MENPWLKLRCEAPYVLDIDRADIARYNKLKDHTKKKVVVDTIPEPFIGNPTTARVVLLGLNPGHDDADKVSYENAEFREAMFRNLHHEPQKYPFYPLNPAFAETGAGKWWQRCTRNLHIATGLDTAALAERLLVIEWFPYHSVSSGFSLRPVCESQAYSFQLAKNMLRNKLVIRMRSKSRWELVDQRFGRLPALKNPQCGHISAGNTEDNLFRKIVGTLSEDSDDTLSRWYDLDAQTAAREVLPCCGSTGWAESLASRRPFATPQELFDTSDAVWAGLNEDDWREAFDSHPRIGQHHARAATAESLAWSSEEQRAALSPDDDAKLALAEQNRQYEERFGRIFIVCASGKSASEILAICKARMQNDASTERLEAAEQQRQITQLRLRRWLGVN